MIPEFVNAWEQNKDAIRAKFQASHPESYDIIVSTVVEHMPWMDKERIVTIDHGHYQGTLLFVIGEKGYQPSKYWSVLVAYGSCSGCDTLYAIRGFRDDAPTESQVNDYMTLALHIVQGLKEIT